MPALPTPIAEAFRASPESLLGAPALGADNARYVGGVRV